MVIWQILSCVAHKFNTRVTTKAPDSSTHQQRHTSMLLYSAQVLHRSQLVAFSSCTVQHSCIAQTCLCHTTVVL